MASKRMSVTERLEAMTPADWEKFFSEFEEMEAAIPLMRSGTQSTINMQNEVLCLHHDFMTTQIGKLAHDEGEQQAECSSVEAAAPVLLHKDMVRLKKLFPPDIEVLQAHLRDFLTFSMKPKDGALLLPRKHAHFIRLRACCLFWIRFVYKANKDYPPLELQDAQILENITPEQDKENSVECHLCKKDKTVDPEMIRMKWKSKAQLEPHINSIYHSQYAKSLRKYRSEYRSESDENPSVVCPRCNETFGNYELLIQHLKSRKQLKSEKMTMVGRKLSE